MFGAKIKLRLLFLCACVSERAKVWMRDGLRSENEAGAGEMSDESEGTSRSLASRGPLRHSATELLTSSRLERGSERGTSEIREKDRVSRGYIMAFFWRLYPA